MRNGKAATRPSARRDELEVRIGNMDEVVSLITWPNGFSGGQSSYPAFLVKPGQTGIKFGSSGLAFDRPRHILWVPYRNAQRMVVGLDGKRMAGRQFAIPQSCPVKPGQSWSKRKKGFDRQTSIRPQPPANHQQGPQDAVDRISNTNILGRIMVGFAPEIRAYISLLKTRIQLFQGSSRVPSPAGVAVTVAGVALGKVIS